MNDAPTIIIERKGNRFTVRVEPDNFNGHFNATYSAIGGARTFARMTARLRDFRVDDRSGEPEAARSGVPITSRKGART